MKIFVGLSGGVDSAVSAARLLGAGHTVVGVFIKVWHPDWLDCNWHTERLDAMRVAAHLKIPFLTCDSTTTYRDAVAAYFINEYAAGRTPNPDVLCNQHVKFGSFLEFAQQYGADAIATGHYARRIDTKHGPELHHAIDRTKDQSYFLWSLTNQQLAKAYFPIGESLKSEVREEAKKRHLPVSAKRDSQGICFLGQVDIKEFLSHYVSLVQGTVLDESGRTIGYHDGALVYTIGQRHGFTITASGVVDGPRYVTGKDVEANTITVSQTPPTRPPHATIQLKNIGLRQPLYLGESVTAVLRYHGNEVVMKVTSLHDGQLILNPTTAYELPSAGQSCVLYKNTHCLGGGIIV
jgi:tRNA-specific 2-thiouridylase